MYKIIKGDIIELAKSSEFDVVVHGVNCFCTMGAGLAPQMDKAFGCSNFEKENPKYRGDFNKLGTLDFVELYQEREDLGSRWVRYPDEEEFITGKKLIVVNAYTQFKPGANLKYSALILCLQKLNYIFAGKHILLPKIGCGIAGGDWETVESFIKQTMKNCNVTTVEYGK